MRLLRELTAGRFRDGAVARVVVMGFWTRGEAPTFEEFAQSWTKAKTEEHQLLTPEYAYLTDLKHQRADGGWKALRTAKAKSALRRWRESLRLEERRKASQGQGFVDARSRLRRRPRSRIPYCAVQPVTLVTSLLCLEPSANPLEGPCGVVECGRGFVPAPRSSAMRAATR
jgi:hypothetical protein